MTLASSSRAAHPAPSRDFNDALQRNGATPAPAGARSARPLSILIVVPTLHAGAADVSVLELVRTLVEAGHRAVVVSRGGRLEADITEAGGLFVYANTASRNPVVILRNAAKLAYLIGAHGCDVVHAHGRAPAWSAFLAARLRRVPFLTTWYKGFREQNRLKHIYNGIMARGDRVIAASEQIAALIHDRYDTPRERISVVGTCIDAEQFDPAAVAPDRIEAVRHGWGVDDDTKVVLVVGRMVRRKGHHVVVQAARRMKEAGIRDFLCVFVGEDEGRTRYSGELWDLVLASGTADVIRISGPVDDLPATYAAAWLVASAALQEEGLGRGMLEAQAMARPVIATELAAGPDVVLTTPADRMTGLRIAPGDDAALAAALTQLLALPEQACRAMGARGRAWVLTRFGGQGAAETMLRLYGEMARRRSN